MTRTMRVVLAAGLALLAVCAPVQAQDGLPVYDMGQPVLTDVWVNPAGGSDGNSGATREQALATLTEAWNRIPTGQELSETGYHIWLMPGTYATEAAPNYWESRYGTFAFPIIIEAAEGQNTVYLPTINLFDSRYIYFINLNIEAGGDAFHCERCDHLLVRGGRFRGDDPDTFNTQETVKVNQSQYVYLEGNDISGAWDNAVDFVAVQYGHISGNHIHDAGDWCLYLKGGSAAFRVEGNRLDNCGTGGFTAGQGTGFQFMSAPYIQYEAYDIQFVNNVVHDTDGAGAGVQGGYNILIAHNTFYRVGARSHVLEVGFGSRSCDGQPGDSGRENCEAYAGAGGWGNSAGADGSNYVRIPNRNVYIYNNVFYNPTGYQSQWQHLSIPAPFDDAAIQAGSDVPLPALADDNLQIRGNVIWNGAADHPLGVEAEAGCAADNPTCNAAQLTSENTINRLEPQLTDPEAGDFQPVSGGSLFQAVTFPIPDFPDAERPAGVADSVLDNPVPTGIPPGAYGG